jgi:hemerythrin superfamily protein
VDAIEVLEADHREVEELFTRAEGTVGAARAEVVRKICAALTLHTEAEEQVLYPAMREAGLDDLVDEAEEEHATVKDLVAALVGMDEASAAVDSVLGDLKANVEHHVHGEESEAFPRFCEAVDQTTLDELGGQLEQTKKESRAVR